MMDIYFHIGLHKTGSTWLQKHLFSNLEYFNLLNDYVRPWEDPIIKKLVLSDLESFDVIEFSKLINSKYKKNKINIISSERLSGHPISKGFDSELIAQKIYKSFPNAKIIIVTRETKSFISSSYKQIVKQGYPGSFQSYINGTSWFFPVSSSKYFKHENIVNKYLNLFSPNNVLELKFENFKENKDEFLSHISNFIKLKIDVKENQKNHNVNKTFSNSRIRSIRFLNNFRKSDYAKRTNLSIFYNSFSIFSLSKKAIFIISLIISAFFSNKKF